MTTSNTMSLSSVISLEDKPIPAFEIGYLKATAQDGAYGSFMKAFLEERARDPAITKAFIARRSGKSPEQITRYLASPGNWTIDTCAVLCAAIGYKPVFEVEKIQDMRQGNACHPLSSACNVNSAPNRQIPEEPSLVVSPISETSASPSAFREISGQPSNFLDLPNRDAIPDSANSGISAIANYQIKSRYVPQAVDILIGVSNSIDPPATQALALSRLRAGVGA